MDRYIGLDVSATSCSFSVIGPSGKRLKSALVETNGKALVEFLKIIPGTLHLCFEEGAQSEWLYEILAPHVSQVVVAGVSRSRGPKSDERNALELAQSLRIGAIKTQVYKSSATFGCLRDLARVYAKVVGDVVRIKNRIKALYRSRGISTVGSVTAQGGRGRSDQTGRCDLECEPP